MMGIERRIVEEMDHPDLREWAFSVWNRSLLWLTWSMTASAGLSQTMRDDVVTAVYLVHRGLEVHEIGEVRLSGQPPEPAAVLAGDFFSSKYYLMLAKRGLIPLIGNLARAVREISEYKVRRARWPWDRDAEGYRNVCVSIETALFHALRRWLSLSDPWPRLIERAGEGFAVARGGAWGNGAVTPSLVDVYLWHAATPEERRAIREEDPPPAARIRALYAKYNTAGWMGGQLAEVCRELREWAAGMPAAASQGIERVCAHWESCWAGGVPVAKER